ncbi:MAG: Gfo/Idh/MocA family oxidoreductase [Sphaerochaeta sp.]|nr:Gfo/Idh/MocA family oxidoreductase [Sphaerochaeta sp.]
MKPIRIALLGAGNRGRYVYAEYAKQRPNEMKIVAVAEPDDAKRSAITEEHAIGDAFSCKDWRHLFEQDLAIDGVIIATQDTMHREPILAAMEKGYHILCEKPIVTTEEHSREIARKAEGFDKVFVIGHVLRYSPFFTRVKAILDSGQLGRLIGIELNESVGHIHQAHSFVRGHWRNKEESSPMILAKSCHDMDMLCYLAGSRCESLSSYGDLFHFKAENAPQGAPMRCLDGCPAERECPYAAQKIYLGKKTDWPVNAITTDLSMEGRIRALEHGPWGRCVYHCDNNVVDHQTVAARFANGVVANFTMSGFTMETHRTLRLLGTKAELNGDMEAGIITFDEFSSREHQSIRIEPTQGGHSGSDELFVSDFIRQVRTGDKDGKTSINASLESHFMAFAAESSRLADGKKIDIASFARDSSSGK